MDLERIDGAYGNHINLYIEDEHIKLQVVDRSGVNGEIFIRYYEADLLSKFMNAFIESRHAQWEKEGK